MFAGLDWARNEHAICVVDDGGRVVARFTVAHDRKGLKQLVSRLGRLGTAPIPVAIERPSGLIVDVLVDAGQPVVPIHPNVVKATRARYSAAHGKSDPGDAYILADMLRTDGHRFKQLQPLSDELRALRALVRTRDDLVAHKVGITNQLRALLESSWPGGANVFADIASPIALTFLKSYPTPASAARLGPGRMAGFLKKHSYSGGRSAEELLARMRSAPESLVGDVEAAANNQLVKCLVAVVRLLVQQLKELTASVELAVAQLPAGRVVMSFPRAGKVNAAQILTELVDPKRWESCDHLAAQAGVVPVTYASGKRRHVGFRWACNKRLRRGLTTWADHSRHDSPWAADIYDRARARGQSHAHATRVLARAWLRVLWRCLLTGDEYAVEQHAAAQKFAA
jgi:transposase